MSRLAVIVCAISSSALLLTACAVKKSAEQQSAQASVHQPQRVPDIFIRDGFGRTVRLCDIYKQRPLVLSVYLGAGCPMCVMNMKQLSQRAERIRSYGWQVAAFSNDTPEENRTALTRNSLDSSYVQPGGAFEIPLYSDSDHVAMQALGCYRRALDTERHGIFLIDTQGVVRFSAIDRRPFEDYEQLMDSIRVFTSKKDPLQ
jgi:peroxiredoxin